MTIEKVDVEVPGPAEHPPIEPQKPRLMPLKIARSEPHPRPRSRPQSGQWWWDIWFAATILVLLGIVTQSWPRVTADRVGVLITLALLSLGYILLSRPARRDVRFAVALVALLVLGAGLATNFNPNMALFQAVAFPLLWHTLPDLRSAVVANVALAVSVTVGFLNPFGGADISYQQALTIEVVSLVGSVALGVWMTRIGQLSDERRRLLDALTSTQDQLAQLNRDAGVTSERERLAREIHDTIAQSLTGIVMLSQHAQRELQSSQLDSLAERLETLESHARDALVETRSLVTAGSPVELGEGIVPALERLSERFVLDTGIDVVLESDDEARTPGRFSRDSEVVLLRSAQESLANIRKHSEAASAVLGVRVVEGAVIFSAADNGIGFDVAARTTGHGLAGMRARLALAGGSLEIVTAPGKGTTLHATLPTGVGAAGADPFEPDYPASIYPAQAHP